MAPPVGGWPRSRGDASADLMWSAATDPLKLDGPAGRRLAPVDRKLSAYDRAMLVRWLTVFIDRPEPGFAAVRDFWLAATGTTPSPSRGERGEFATLLPADGDAYVRIQRVADGPGGSHLDFHVDMEDYYQAKASLFTAHRTRTAIVWVEDEWGRRLVDEVTTPFRTVGFRPRQ